MSVNDWIISTLVGISLGLALYGCVRMRMHFGPIIRRRFGNHFRRAYWLATIIVMVALANGALLILRRLVEDTTSTNSLMPEIWFATLATIIACALIYRRVRRNA